MRGGGRLALVWNVRDRSVDWVGKLVRITGSDNSETTLATLVSRPHFRPFERAVFPFRQRIDRSSLIAHIRSRSHVAALDCSAQDELIQEVLRLCDTHPDLAGRDRFDLPYVTRAFRAVKE